MHGPQGPTRPFSAGTRNPLGLVRRARVFGVQATASEVERYVVPALQWFFHQSLGGSVDVSQARRASASAWIAQQLARDGRFSTPVVARHHECSSTHALRTSEVSSPSAGLASPLAAPPRQLSTHNHGYGCWRSRQRLSTACCGGFQREHLRVGKYVP